MALTLFLGELIFGGFIFGGNFVLVSREAYFGGRLMFGGAYIQDFMVFHYIHKCFVQFQILQQARVPLTSQAACKRAYGSYRITSRMICAGAARGSIDSCQGDSGGPLVCKDSTHAWYIVGATSWGIGCARRGYYGVYADVKNMRQWVKQVSGL